MVSKVELAFNRLLKEYNKKKHVWKKSKDGKLVATPGRWTLDSAYGGFKVAEITNKGGGEKDLFSQNRMGGAAFVRWVNTVVAAKRQK